MKFQKKKKPKPQISLLAKFVKFLFQYRIQMEEDHVNLNSLTIFILQLISFIQYAGIIIMQYDNHMAEQNRVGEFKLLIIASKLARPYLYLLEYDRNITEGLFLIPFTTLIVFIITQFILHILKNSDPKKDQAKNKHVYLSYIIAYFYSVYIPVFNIPFIDMTLLSLQNIESNNIISTLFASICIIMEITIFIFCFITNETINIKIKNYFVLCQTLAHYWIHFIIYFELTINSLKLERHSQFYIIFTLNVIQIVLKLWDSFKNYANIYKRVMTDICLTIYNLLIIILILTNNINDGPSNDNIIVLYMLYPILIYIIIKCFEKIHNEAMLNNSLKLSPKIIQYRIATILDQYKNINRSYQQNAYHVVRIILYLKYHCEICEDLKCGCNTKNITLEQIINYYLKNQVYELGESIAQMKDLHNQFQFYLHYLSFISYLGMNTSALKQSNLMLYESQTNSLSQFATVGNNNQLTERRQSSSSNAKSKISKESIPHIKLQNLNALQKIKLSIIQSSIRQFMSSEFQTSDKSQQDNLEHAVKLFLQSESNNQQLKRKLMKIIQKKRDFYSKLLLLERNFNLFEQCKELITKLQSYEDEINKLYAQFPSQKIQALSAFFQAEIRNNYFIAYKLSNLTSISDEKLLKMQAQTTFNLFTHKVVYLLIGFDEKSHHLKVINSSNLCNEFFGITNEEFQMMKTIEHLLPTGFQNMHNVMVQQFLVDSVSKYFRTANTSFCSVGFRNFKSINFFYDIDSNQLEDLRFACFFEDYEDQNAYLIVNNHQSVISVSRNFGSKLGYSKKAWEPAYNSILKANITKIIENFKDHVDQFLLEGRPNGEVIIQLEQIPCHFPKNEILINFDKINWESKKHKSQYISDIHLHLKFVQSNILYYIVEIRDAKLEQFTTSRNTSDLEDIDDIQSMEIFKEEIANYPNAIQNISDSYFHNQDQFGVRMEIKKQSLVALNSSKSFMQPNVSLVSPKNQDQKLLFDGSNIKKIKGQQYYQDEKYYEESESADRDMELDKNYKAQNKIDQLQMDDIDIDLQQNIQMQMQMVKEDPNIVQIDDIGSCVSSIAGLKKSKFFKKYELIEKLITSRKFSINFNRMLQFLIFFLIFSLVIQVINIYKSQVDFDRFLQELDMVQIRSNLMGPVEKFILSQYAAINYVVGALLFNYMTMAEAIEKFQYANNDVQYSYQELKVNFNQQLQNSYLLPFFQDQYMNVTQNNYPFLSYRTVSIKEGLFLYLEASFNFINIDFTNVFQLDISQSFFVFAFGNYIGFTNLFKQLNQEILIYSQNRSVVVSQDWTNILIPSIIISAFFIGIAYIQYQKYLFQYDKILEMFTLIDNVWLQRDMDRYRGILSLLSKDSDVVFKYTFDLELKESFLQAEDQRKEKIALNQKQQKAKSLNNMNKKRFKISYWPSLIIFVGIFSVYFAFIFLTDQLAQNYFKKYPQTTELFNILSDLSVASSGVFATRELSYSVQSELFFFFTKDVTNIQLIHLFFEDIEIINQFIILYNSFDQTSYLTSQTFYNQMALLMQQDACQFLPDYKRENAQIHCDLLYEGVLRRGYQETLIKVRDSLLNEFESSQNFTNQVFSMEEQLEIGLIGYDIINGLRQQFKNELVYYTSNLSKQILIINLCYIATSLLCLIIMNFLVQYFKWEFKVMKQTILLLPQASLFLDAQLDREIRQIVIKDNMI